MRIGTISQHIGNAVPVVLGAAIAVGVWRHLERHDLKGGWDEARPRAAARGLLYGDMLTAGATCR